MESEREREIGRGGYVEEVPLQRKQHKRRNDMKRESLEGGGKVRNGVPGPDKRPQICSTEGKWHWQFTQMCCSLNFPPDQPSPGCPRGEVGQER